MIINHLLGIAKQIPSQHYDNRPNAKISLIVIHNISLPPGEFNNQYVQDFFTNHLDTDAHPYFKTLENIRVSAHLFIRRNGSVIQFVAFDKRAWHAGVSSFNGRENCNDFSIGIELEGTDDIIYTELQYQALNRVIKALKSHYPIKTIVGHADIAPGRKTDPGETFNWSKINEYHSTSKED